MVSGISDLKVSKRFAVKLHVRTDDDTKFDSTWSMSLPSRELKKVQEAIDKSPRSSGIFSSLLMPTRTNVSGLKADLFFPTLLNQTKRVQDGALRFFVSIGAMFLDLASFPIRLVTTLPRVVYSKKFQSEAPFHKFLADMKVSDEILSKDRVFVKLEWEEIGNRLYEKGANKRVRVHNILKCFVNLTDAPSYSKDFSHQQKVTILTPDLPSARKMANSKLSRSLSWIKSWMPGKKN